MKIVCPSLPSRSSELSRAWTSPILATSTPTMTPPANSGIRFCPRLRADSRSSPSPKNSWIAWVRIALESAWQIFRKKIKARTNASTIDALTSTSAFVIPSSARRISTNWMSLACFLLVLVLSKATVCRRFELGGGSVFHAPPSKENSLLEDDAVVLFCAYM